MRKRRIRRYRRKGNRRIRIKTGNGLNRYDNGE
jgi:hypothetical protein